MLNRRPLRVLVVDDTVLYRKIVSDALSNIPDVEVVGSAHNGKAAVSKLSSLQPDLLTLDIEMPEMSGLQVLEHIRQNSLETGAIMLSTLTQEGGAMTMKALELGAFDFIPKPQSGTLAENRLKIESALTPIIREIHKNIFRPGKRVPFKHTPGRGKTPAHHRASVSTTPPPKKISIRSKSEIVAIGISTGGPNALAKMLPMIPGNIGVPILIVQHMPPMFTQSLAKSLAAKCSIEVREARQGEPLLPNTAYIAPGGKQMKIVAAADGRNRMIKITDDPPENSCKPSVDYLFRSVAQHYLGRATGVIMTGMGSDGNQGLKLMKQNGATVIAQDKETCVVYGMPKVPVESGLADLVLPLDAIAEKHRTNRKKRVAFLNKRAEITFVSGKIMVKINPQEVKLLSAYIHKVSGISIDASKAYLLETRLGKLLKEERCSGYSEFHSKIQMDKQSKLEKKIIDAITTNETLFFRDTSPFDVLRHKIIPELIDNRSKSGSLASMPALRIWSSACSTGQEIYSIAIVLKELLGGNAARKIKLMGTDLSDAAISQASSGIYNQFEIERGLSKEKLQQYFTPSNNKWKIKDEIRSMATFQHRNLMKPFTGLGKFDIIFCRNVAIYFTPEDRKKLYNKIAEVLQPDGYLIIGSTESLTGVCPRFIPKRHLRSVYYQLN
jgi:two-component system chemotaxis response regulator CheB